MAMLADSAVLPAGDLRHRVSLSMPGQRVPDGDGGFTATWTPLSPATVWCAIESASAQKLERLVSNTVAAAATHVLMMRYHAGVTTKTRVTFGSRVFEVVGVVNVDERRVRTVALCTEVAA